MASKQNLDFQYLNLLRIIQQIHEKKQQLQTCMENGFFCMSKARYVMGMKQVSKLNYAAVMSANVTVNVEQNDDEVSKFEVQHNKNERKVSEKQNKTKSGDQKEAILRKRNVGNSSSEDKNIETDDTDHVQSSINELPSAVSDIDISEEDKIATPTDPLNWFGVLVPQSLRQCQIEFRKASIIIGDISTLQSQLKLAKTKIKKLNSEVSIK
uniref:coiled-coil domain-containing protein 115-like n=1 Tax=Styela clava TaxID=7725 RepID=UPI00193A043E|nr:coiled-coil domain-containing protein 115-like [Styela clava]